MTDDQAVIDALADAIDPADPDAAEKSRLMAELLLGDEADRSDENPSA